MSKKDKNTTNDKKTTNKSFRPIWCKWWFWIIIAVLIFGNIALVLWGNDGDKGQWLTLISGWVSGVATFFVGIIAFRQGEHNSFISKRQNTMLEISNDLQRFISTVDDVCDVSGYMDIIIVYALGVEDASQRIQTLNKKVTLRAKIYDLQMSIGYYRYCSEHLKTFFDQCMQLFEFVSEDMKFDVDSKSPQEVKKWYGDLTSKLFDLLNAISLTKRKIIMELQTKFIKCAYFENAKELDEFILDQQKKFEKAYASLKVPKEI